MTFTLQPMNLDEAWEFCVTHQLQLALEFDKEDRTVVNMYQKELELELQPVEFDEACAFVNAYHLHHPAPQGHKFSIGVNDGEEVVGVVIVGRPTSRHMDDGWTVEVTRLCTLRTLKSKNAASKLYAAAWRAARAMGYRRLITYTLKTESGTSVIAAGYEIVGETSGKSWNTRTRPRVDKHALEPRWRWEKSLDTRPED